jgi:hypothetical protein
MGSHCTQSGVFELKVIAFVEPRLAEFVVRVVLTFNHRSEMIGAYSEACLLPRTSVHLLLVVLAYARVEATERVHEMCGRLRVLGDASLHIDSTRELTGSRVLVVLG